MVFSLLVVEHQSSNRSFRVMTSRARSIMLRSEAYARARSTVRASPGRDAELDRDHSAGLVDLGAVVQAVHQVRDGRRLRPSGPAARAGPRLRHRRTRAPRPGRRPPAARGRPGRDPGPPSGPHRSAAERRTPQRFPPPARGVRRRATRRRPSARGRPRGPEIPIASCRRRALAQAELQFLHQPRRTVGGGEHSAGPLGSHPGQAHARDRQLIPAGRDQPEGDVVLVRSTVVVQGGQDPRHPGPLAHRASCQLHHDAGRRYCGQSWARTRATVLWMAVSRST